MAFYDVVVLYEDAFEEAKSGNDRATFTVKRTLLAKSDTPKPSFVTIGTSTASWPGLGGEPIDQINTLRNFDGIVARCSSRSFSWLSGTENGVKIDLTYEGLSPYENTDSGGSQQPRSSEPNTWRRISISTSQVTQPATDSQGRAFTNSAGDPVDGLEEETSLAVLKYTNEFNPNPNFEAVWEYLNTCNDDIYLGCEEYTLRVTGFSAEFDDATMLWKTSLELTYNPKSWVIKYHDAGFNELVSDGGVPPTYTRKAIMDATGNPVSQPVPLNGMGGQAAILEPVSQDRDKGAYYRLTGAATLRAPPYEAKPFANMLTELRMY